MIAVAGPHLRDLKIAHLLASFRSSVGKSVVISPCLLWPCNLGVAMATEQPKEDVKLGRSMMFLGIAGLFQMAAGAFVLCLLYGIVVIIFRAASHVELWNPFR
jgi:hypothetical protein